MRCSSLSNVATTVLVMACAIGISAQAPAPPAKPVAFHVMEATIDEVRGALQSGRTTCRVLVDSTSNESKRTTSRDRR